MLYYTKKEGKFMTISQRIFSLLEQKGLTQKMLAESIGVSAAAVSEWRKKGTTPSAEKISAIAEFLGVSVEYILTGQTSSNSLKNENNTDILIAGNSENSKNIVSSFYESQERENKEILNLINGLPLEEKAKLILQLYELDKKHKQT